MIRTATVKPQRLSAKADVLILPLLSDKKTVGKLSGLDRSLATLARAYLKKKTASGDLGETMLVAQKLPRGTSHLLLLGLGDSSKLDAERATQAGGAAAKALSGRGFQTASFLLGDLLPASRRAAFTGAFVKGFSLAQYRYSVSAKPGPDRSPGRLEVVCDEPRGDLTKAARRAKVIADHNAIARDLVNAPANALTPVALADASRTLCRKHGIRCKVVGPAEMKKLGMGAILSVASGSRQEPRLIVMHYNKTRADLPMVCLVGKGVTFDTGGISLKPWNRMNEMKGDMGGAAVVVAATVAAATLKIPLQIVTVVPAVENMPGGMALKPGDVVTAYGGKTIEVLTTDAEGRLILADAITYVRKHFDPIVTVDFATLTGAVEIALGTRIAGVMGNDQGYVDELIAAGNEAGEPVWQLPLDDYFYEAVKGDISDYKNYSGRAGSTITAAALLGKFAGKEPWIHVDIAGTFWAGSPGASYHSKGATGYGVDLVVRFLERTAGR